MEPECFEENRVRIGEEATEQLEHKPGEPYDVIAETTASKTFTKTCSSNGTLAFSPIAGGTINYTYYLDGKVKTIVAPRNITTSMQFDIAGNQTQLNLYTKFIC